MNSLNALVWANDVAAPNGRGLPFYFLPLQTKHLAAAALAGAALEWTAMLG